MSGGFSRLVAVCYVPACAGLIVLSGCALIAPKPATVPSAQQPVTPSPSAASAAEAASEAAAQAAAAAAASAVIATPATPPVITPPPKPKRHYFRWRHRPARPPKPLPPPPPPPVAPVPPPIIAIRLLAPEQTRGLLESEVKKNGGKVIGRAVDMLVDAGGIPRQIVVNLSGFLGVGDRQMNFPWDDICFSPSARKAPISLRIPTGGVPEGKPPAPSAPPLIPLSDATVARADGAPVGRIVDVLIDAQAQPQAVVLDIKNSLNGDERNIAADWSALHFVQKGQALQLQAQLNEAQIKAAPLYTSDKPVRAVSPAGTPTTGAVLPSPQAFSSCSPG
jgi:hypothetical protein